MDYLILLGVGIGSEFITIAVIPNGIKKCSAKKHNVALSTAKLTHCTRSVPTYGTSESEGEYRRAWPGSGRAVTQTDVPGR
jgi:hypothetical protein